MHTVKDIISPGDVVILLNTLVAGSCTWELSEAVQGYGVYPWFYEPHPPIPSLKTFFVFTICPLTQVSTFI